MGLPAWLVHGVVLGALASIAVAAVFAAGSRLLPAGSPAGAGDGGADRRRAEIRGYLRAIGEPFAEDHGVAGERVPFYLTDRDVAVTFDPRVYYRLAPTETAAVLVEHELPGWRLGDRLPFETPDVGVDEDPDAPRRSAYDELGLPAGASAEAVERAYRERVKEVHPDQGGDRAAFVRLREAYAAASEDAADRGTSDVPAAGGRR